MLPAALSSRLFPQSNQPNPVFPFVKKNLPNNQIITQRPTADNPLEILKFNCSSEEAWEKTFTDFYENNKLKEIQEVFELCCEIDDLRYSNPTYKQRILHDLPLHSLKKEVDGIHLLYNIKWYLSFFDNAVMEIVVCGAKKFFVWMCVLSAYNIFQGIFKDVVLPHLLSRPIVAQSIGLISRTACQILGKNRPSNGLLLSVYFVSSVAFEALHCALEKKDPKKKITSVVTSVSRCILPCLNASLFHSVTTYNTTFYFSFSMTRSFTVRSLIATFNAGIEPQQKKMFDLYKGTVLLCWKQLYTQATEEGIPKLLPTQGK